MSDRINISIPGIPADLNPDGLEVEVSLIGEVKEGIWPLDLHKTGWRHSEGSMDNDNLITARLIPKPLPYEDVPIVDGRVMIPNFGSIRPPHYGIGHVFLGNIAHGGYAYADGFWSAYPIRYGGPFAGALPSPTDKSTSLERATHVRLVHLDRLQEIKGGSND